MLILNRKIGESIMINGDIEIKILDINGGKIKIGISASRDNKIFRKEVYDSIVKENKKAVKLNIDILKSLSKK